MSSRWWRPKQSNPCFIRTKNLSSILENKAEQGLVPTGSAHQFLFVAAVMLRAEAHGSPFMKRDTFWKDIGGSCGTPRPGTSMIRLPWICNWTQGSRKSPWAYFTLLKTSCQPSLVFGHSLLCSALLSSYWDTSITERQQKVMVNKQALEPKNPRLNDSSAT